MCVCVCIGIVRDPKEKGAFPDEGGIFHPKLRDVSHLSNSEHLYMLGCEYKSFEINFQGAICSMITHLRAKMVL